MNNFELAKEYFLDGCIFLKAEDYYQAEYKFIKSLELIPDRVSTLTNLSAAQLKLKKYSEARVNAQKAISLDSDNGPAYMNLGLIENELKSFEAAFKFFDKAISLKPNYAEAWFNKGGTLADLKRYDEAITHYDKALSLKPDIDWSNGVFLQAKMKVCNWSDFLDSSEIIFKKVIANEKVATPFSLLALNDDPLLHKKASEIYAQDKHPTPSSLEVIPKSAKKEKIRIAYFSPDFRNHPVSFLTSELFELHDRHRFEVFAFSLQQAPVGDEIILRLRNGFDKFFDVGNMSDKEIAQFAREHEVDIAIDLAGYTKYSRTGIFSNRAAPIQVSYLGYPGTMGADYMDYLIADKTIIPVESQSYYSEKVVYLPNSYQVNDRKRLISERQFTRQELVLPENGFVFCCFNNNFKILPTTFDSWMRILKSVDGSVLWLFKENPWVVENLKKEAQKQGIDGQRLVFAERMPLLSEHLARHLQADLFLDTFPYNAHTTASDALWAGLPVLTLMGQSFASRVAASLLNAIGLPELITNTQEEYEALAIELAMNPKKLATIKEKIRVNRLTTPLFNTPLFTKNIEAAYIKMMERYHADLEPDHIAIV
jgi:predicted O-linked N-acetylglucosamine transferase (SPINDLY family)